MKRASRSQKKDSSLTSLWKRGASRGLPSPWSSLSRAGAVLMTPGLHTCSSLSADQPAVASPGIWQVAEIVLNSYGCTEADGANTLSTPSWGLTQCLSPNLGVQAPLSSIPRHHQVLCLQTVPAWLGQGPGAIRCLSAVSCPLLAFPMAGNLFLSQIPDGPLFSEAQKWVMEKARSLSDLCRLGWSGSR